MDYINLTVEKIAEIRGTKVIVPKLVTDSLTIDFEAMTDIEKLIHKSIEELDTKALELCITEGISLEEAREKMKIEINSIYGVPKNYREDDIND